MQQSAPSSCSCFSMSSLRSTIHVRYGAEQPASSVLHLANGNYASPAKCKVPTIRSAALAFAVFRAAAGVSGRISQCRTTPFRRRGLRKGEYCFELTDDRTVLATWSG